MRRRGMRRECRTNYNSMMTKEEIIAASQPYRQRSGVYFLINKGEIVYVGKSTGIDGRINAHISDKEFDRIFVYECVDPEMSETESYYIRKFTPRYNRSQNPFFKREGYDPAVDNRLNHESTSVVDVSGDDSAPKLQPYAFINKSGIVYLRYKSRTYKVERISGNSVFIEEKFLVGHFDKLFGSFEAVAPSNFQLNSDCPSVKPVDRSFIGAPSGDRVNAKH